MVYKMFQIKLNPCKARAKQSKYDNYSTENGGFLIGEATGFRVIHLWLLSWAQ